MMSKTVKKLIGIFLTLCIIIAPFVVALYYNQSTYEKSMSYGYPYDDCEYLEIKGIDAAEENSQLKTVAISAIYSAGKGITPCPQQLSAFISTTQYAELSQISKCADVEIYDNENFNIPYINVMSHRDRAVVTFSVNYMSFTHDEYNENERYNKLYLYCEDNTWKVKRIFLTQDS